MLKNIVIIIRDMTTKIRWTCTCMVSDGIWYGLVVWCGGVVSCGLDLQSLDTAIPVSPMIYTCVDKWLHFRFHRPCKTKLLYRDGVPRKFV